MAFSLEHIDPVKHSLICGLSNDFNEVTADLTYNKSKNNRFVPYRVKEYPAPVTFGDICEFLIKGEWTVCEFGGKLWSKECRRIGFNSTQTGSAVGSSHRDNKVGIFNPVFSNKVSQARLEGSINGAAARRRSVQITTPDGEVIEFESCTAAGKHFGLHLGELSKCCNGKIQTVKGFRATFT